MEKGRAEAIVTVCRACRPPANNSTIATMPIRLDQKTRCQTGVLLLPPEASMSTTIALESDEVTKKITTMIIEIIDRTCENGKYSRNWLNVVLGAKLVVNTIREELDHMLSFIISH